MPGMTQKYVVLSGLLILLVAASCHKKSKQDKVPVAKVLDKYLYQSDIQHIFPSKITKEDSLSMAKSYISTWVKTQLILNKAELNLPNDQLDISQQIETYRSSLLIYKYEELMLKDKLDTVVSDSEIEEYFNLNAANFILNENLVKALFIKVPKKAPNIDKLKIWYKSDQREEIKKLDSYCYNYATKYDYFKDNWVLFSFIQSELPNRIENEDEYLKSNKYIEQDDKNFLYFVYVKEKNSKGAISPINFVHNRIKDIIINKRKVKFLTDLETKIYNDAQDHDNFVIYNYEKK
jgi:hypothetical protein